jgi:inositol-1,3,4-trisphosphate 5/6-kinase/inositol-tetrakisphosphate 1-kinase
MPLAVWEANVGGYLQQHPGVKLIDNVDGIKTLQNRATMLSPLKGGGVTVTVGGDQRAAAQLSCLPACVLGRRTSGSGSGSGPPPSPPPAAPQPQLYEPESTDMPATVRAPLQVVLQEGVSLQAARQRVEAAGLQPPLLVKPLWTDGREGSHGLALLQDLKALERLLTGTVSSELKPPLVVQQFVEHGGVLHKVYVLGLQTVVTRRPSLGDRHMASAKAVQQLPRISCQRQSASASSSPQRHPYRLSWGEQAGGDAAACEGYPPEWLTDALASHLRQQLGLQLFNFDLICPECQCEVGPVQYYVVDINYFPGVDKIPGFEQLFVDFLKATIQDSGWQEQQQQQQQLLLVHTNGESSSSSTTSCGT